MPTLLKEGRYRLFFYSDEGASREPAQVHVTAGEGLAKFWLQPVELASSKRLRAHEIKPLPDLVERHRTGFLEAWNAHFDA